MRRFLCAPVALLLVGCASFSGSPEPVITTVQAQQMIAGFQPGAVIAHMSALNESERTTYRNRVVASYLMAADGKFDQFRRAMSRSVKGGNIALDLATLGITGLASALPNAAAELASGATALAGGRATLNRELYFEKTLPTLLSLMESRRLTVRADILRGLSKGESDYSIEEAFSDIWRYQSAASIDGAIQQAAAAAASEAAAANVDYSSAVELCRPPRDIAARRRTVMIALEQVATRAKAPTVTDDTTNARSTLRAAAVAAGMSDAQPAADAKAATDQLLAISDYLLAACSAATLDAFTAQLETQE